MSLHCLFSSCVGPVGYYLTYWPSCMMGADWWLWVPLYFDCIRGPPYCLQDGHGLVHFTSWAIKAFSLHVAPSRFKSYPCTTFIILLLYESLKSYSEGLRVSSSVGLVITHKFRTLRNLFISPSLWTHLSPLTWSFLLTGEPSASFRSLKTARFSLGLLYWESFWLVCTARNS